MNQWDYFNILSKLFFFPLMIDLFFLKSIFEPKQASMEELCEFHSEEYIQKLKDYSANKNQKKLSSEELQEFGLEYDCPLFSG